MQETAFEEEEEEAPAGLSKPLSLRPIFGESWSRNTPIAARRDPSSLPIPFAVTPASRRALAAVRALPSRIKPMIAQEQRFGHVFLLAPVAVGCGAVLWFSLPYDPPVWPWILALLLFGGAAMASTGSVWLPVLTAGALVLAGMVLAQAESWRRSTIILDSSVTTDIVGMVERSETAGPGRIRYVIDLHTTANPELRRPPGQVTLISRSRQDVFEGGTVIAGRARLSPPSGPALPGLHDFAFSAYFGGTGAVGYFYGAARRVDGLDLQQDAFSRAKRWLFALRARIGERIRTTAPGDAGAFAAAIVTDERRAISDDTVDALRVSGLAHIVAISGLNMALAAGIFFVGMRTVLALFPAVAQAFAVKKLAATGALLMVTGYYLISGFGVSAQRAFIMMAVMLVAVLLDRPSISLRNVALSALIIMVWSPSEILGPSFQMSFAATVALVAGYAAWARRVQDREHEPLPFRHPLVTWAHAGWSFLAGMILTSLIGSLSTAMFSVEHFHRLAMYGLAANLAAMPIISFLVMPAGLVGMLLMPFGLDRPFILLMAQGLEWVIAIAKHVAGWGGDIVMGEQQPWFLPLGVAGFLLLTLMRTKLRYAGVPFLTVAFILFLQGSLRTPADLLVSEDGTLVLLRNNASYMTNRTRLPSFIYDQWKYALRLPEPGKPRLLALEEKGGAETTPRKGQVRDLGTNGQRANLPALSGQRLSPWDEARPAKEQVREARSDEQQEKPPETSKQSAVAPENESTAVGRLVGEAGPNKRQEKLSASALAKARRAMTQADAARFTCVPRAWCAMRSASGVLVVVVEDGRYTSAACDRAGLVIAPRARFSSCRSGTPLLNGATLRKTGALTIDFSGTVQVRHWQVTTAVTTSSRPWSVHRHYDWRRDVYDPSLPAWLSAAAPADQRPVQPADSPPAEEEDGADTFPGDVGE